MRYEEHEEEAGKGKKNKPNKNQLHTRLLLLFFFEQSFTMYTKTQFALS